MMEAHHLGPLLSHIWPFHGLEGPQIHELATSQREGTIPGPLTKGWADLAWEAPRKGLVS